MSIFLPVAGISINLFLLVGAGSMVGFLSGLLGVGGGFLLTPILMMIGIPATIAAASDSAQIVAASSSGVAAHFRLGNVDYKMGSILLVGGLCGSAIGVEVIKALRTLGNADLLITITYIVVLGGVGARATAADAVRCPTTGIDVVGVVGGGIGVGGAAVDEAPQGSDDALVLVGLALFDLRQR